jgi:hypothetical protein
VQIKILITKRMLTESQTKPIQLSCGYTIAPPVKVSTATESKFGPTLDQMAHRYDLMDRTAKDQHRTTVRKNEFLVAYEKSRGNLAFACRIAGIKSIKSRKTVYNWIKADAEFKLAMEIVVEMQRDCVNGKLMMQIAKNEGWAIRHYLSHKDPDFMQKRGSLPPRNRWDT